MVLAALAWGWRRFRPAEGWLLLFLLIAACIVLLVQIVVIQWVPEVHVVWIALLAFFLSYVLAQRYTNRYLAWAILLAYGLLLNTLWLGRLWPPLSTMAAGWEISSDYVQQNWALFIDRMSGWLTAVVRGQQSQETIVFAFGLGLLAWLTIAFATWSIFRQGRPLVAIVIMVTALAINSYFGQTPMVYIVIFIGLSILIMASNYLTNLENHWERKGVDYSAEFRFDLLIYSGAIALVLMTIAFLLPSIKIDILYRKFLDRPAIHQIEDALEQAFAGVRSPVSGRGGTELVAVPSGGQLPRSFLIGGAPELYETVVMTATVEGEIPSPSHWRGSSFDIYTGFGWAISEERQETVLSGEPIPLLENQANNMLQQSVHWIQGTLLTHYTIGQASRFDQEVITFWRGTDDLSRVRGSGNTYTAESLASVASPTQLRSSRQEQVPLEIMARYTSLPETVPDRVHELARQVAGEPTAREPFDQAKAIESFLRQYPYSLDIEAPLSGVDPVDYFLFESQTGYCDYYASAMVVMARSVGLPARLVIGYLAQPADTAGVQTIRQINAHSWAEIYFAGFGWVEFEPTAAFPTAAPAEAGAEIGVEEESPLFNDIAPPPIPVSQVQSTFLWWLLSIPVVALGAIIIWYRLAKKGQRKDGILWAYDKLQQSARRLGQPTPPSQTPQEFETALLHKVELNGLYPEIRSVTNSFIQKQYSGKNTQPEQAIESWKRIRGRFWLLSFWRRIRQIFLRQ